MTGELRCSNCTELVGSWDGGYLRLNLRWHIKDGTWEKGNKARRHRVHRHAPKRPGAEQRPSQTFFYDPPGLWLQRIDPPAKIKCHVCGDVRTYPIPMG
jgi:hypothetical protein